MYPTGKTQHDRHQSTAGHASFGPRWVGSNGSQSVSLALALDKSYICSFYGVSNDQAQTLQSCITQLMITDVVSCNRDVA